MNDYRTRIEQAQPGQIIPMVREIDITCPVEYFAKLSDYGRKKHCCMLESRDYLTEGEAGELTFGTANPALYLTGRGDQFQSKRSAAGGRMIGYLAEHRQRFDFCRKSDFRRRLQDHAAYGVTAG